MKFKKFFSFVMCMVMVLLLAACGSNKPTNSNDGEIGCPNPFTEYETLKEAEKEAKFTLNLPQSIADYSNPVYRLNKESGLLEVIFENGDESITFRKASGSGDISGDYNDYAQVETVNGVTLKGENGKFSLAVWSNDGYTYAVGVQEAMSQSDMLALTAEVK